MDKIVVITDIHANLPALEAVLAAIRTEGYDLLVQTGDVIGIGPYPQECLDLILNTPRLENLKGNHEVYFVNGLSDSQLVTMSPSEVQHHHWTHARLKKEHNSIVAKWPFLIKHEFASVKVAFMHSGLGETGSEIQGIPRNPGGEDLDKLFASHGCDLVFYGHRHEDSDIQGQARYVNPGSLGCNITAAARYCTAIFEHGHYQVENRLITYDDAGLSYAFEEHQVPDRKLICKAFFGGRF